MPTEQQLSDEQLLAEFQLLFNESRTANANDIQTLRNEFQTDLRAVKARLSRPPGSGPGDPANAFLARPSVGLEQDTKFHAWLNSTRTRLSNFSVELPFEIQELTPITGVSIPTPAAGIFGPPQPGLRLAQLLFHATATTGAVTYTKESAYTPGADLVSEGALKPASSLSFVNTTVPIVTLATIAKTSIQSMQDTPMLSTWVDSRLTNAVLLRQEQYLLNDPTAGLMAAAQPLAAGFTPGGTPSSLDLLASAVDQLVSEGFTPNGIVMSAVDVNKARLLKDSQNRYLWASPDSSTGTSAIWSIPLVISPAMAAGSALIGAFSEAAILFDRQLLTVEISFENEDDFIKNLCCFRCELRCGLAIPVPSGLIKLTGLVAAAAAPGGSAKK
jgi:HK97 family phage major capsid protein